MKRVHWILKPSMRYKEYTWDNCALRTLILICVVKALNFHQLLRYINVAQVLHPYCYPFTVKPSERQGNRRSSLEEANYRSCDVIINPPLSPSKILIIQIIYKGMLVLNFVCFSVVFKRTHKHLGKWWICPGRS